MSDEVDLLKRVYDRFNARNIETVLAAMHEDVVWANGMEGGYVNGRDQVRNYWTRQWAMIDPHVEPVAFAHGPEGEVVVEVAETQPYSQGYKGTRGSNPLLFAKGPSFVDATRP
jgi:ketosteroid isomerase-like protein